MTCSGAISKNCFTLTRFGTNPEETPKITRMTEAVRAASIVLSDR